MAKVVTEEERKEGTLDPTNYTRVHMYMYEYNTLFLVPFFVIQPAELPWQLSC